tara:strand:+ start:308 stop:511 length:204 start_codon:yes stop_codon:yes gene_type:complete
MKKVGVLFLVVSVLLFLYGLVGYDSYGNYSYSNYNLRLHWFWGIAKWVGLLGGLMLIVDYIMDKNEK